MTENIYFRFVLTTRTHTHTTMAYREALLMPCEVTNTANAQSLADIRVRLDKLEASVRALETSADHTEPIPPRAAANPASAAEWAPTGWAKTATPTPAMMETPRDIMLKQAPPIFQEIVNTARDNNTYTWGDDDRYTLSESSKGWGWGLVDNNVALGNVNFNTALVCLQTHVRMLKETSHW